MSHAVALSIEHHRDYTGAKVGMWLFLFTEVLLFAGMFLIYAVYRHTYPTDFHHAASNLNLLLGSINTVILLTSSLSMALSISCIHKGNKRASLFFLTLTILFGVLFLVIKYFEWGAKIQHGIYPGSPILVANHPNGEILFFGLYFIMTGFHGLHVLVGVVVLSCMFVYVVHRPRTHFAITYPQLSRFHHSRLAICDEQGKKLWESEPIDDSVEIVKVTVKHQADQESVRKEEFVALENTGLYWHLVDIIWIYLFPLFYLIT